MTPPAPDVSEKTIYRWIKQQSIPAYRVQDQYRFNRAEILEWATSRRLNVSSEIFAEPEAAGQPSLRWSTRWRPAGSFTGSRASTRRRRCARSCSCSGCPEEVDREFLLRVLLAREAIASTAVGDGIAIPHVRNPVVLHIDRPAITLCFLDQPIEYGALDGKPVHTLFTIISPTTRAHLHLMSKLSFVLRTPRSGAIQGQDSRQAILAQVRRVRAGRCWPAVRSRADDFGIEVTPSAAIGPSDRNAS